MKSIEIKISRDFTPTPGPRYIKESDIDNSGESFRKKILYPTFLRALESKMRLVVDLDGTAGYGTSFLEESFGGLIREEHMDYSIIMNNLDLISVEESFLIEDINHYLEDAAKKNYK